MRKKLVIEFKDANSREHRDYQIASVGADYVAPNSIIHDQSNTDTIDTLTPQNAEPYRDWEKIGRAHV